MSQPQDIIVKPSTSGSDSGSGSSSSSSANSQKDARPSQPRQPAAPRRGPSTQSEPPLNRQRSRKHRRHHRRRRRDDHDLMEEEVTDPNQASLISGAGTGTARRNSEFYGLRVPHAQNLSSTSLDSNALLDHREQQYMRPRRSSTMGTPGNKGKGTLGPMPRSRFAPSPTEEVVPDLRRGPTGDYASDYEDDGERSPLLSRITPHSNERSSLFPTAMRRPVSSSSKDSGKRKSTATAYGSVNFPPSVPTSPDLNARTPIYGDIPDKQLSPSRERYQDHVIAIDRDAEAGAVNGSYFPASTPATPPGPERSRAFDAEEDVCFPIHDDVTDGMGTPQQGESQGRRGRRRGPRQWPDLAVLEDWSREEKEQRSEGIRARKIFEPVYVGGRLRPTMRGWHRDAEDLPYRFTYFNDELPSTIHSQTISELVTPGQMTFRNLFMPDPRSYSDDECSSEDEPNTPKQNGGDGVPLTRHSTDLLSINTDTPQRAPSIGPTGPQMKIGEDLSNDRPTWWLDVLSPTKAEMKVLQDAFGIHPLTAEDILMQEAREKVELFRNYYLVSYRTFEQDPNDDDYMEPVNYYVIVFRDGVLSFHFSMTPHGANVRRRIRQLKDYMNISADWISYAIIDNITDAFAPLIQSIEDEVDTIDDIILDVPTDVASKSKEKEKHSSDNDDGEEVRDDGYMLRRIANCRKKVMGLYRLLGNKADVIKGFSKRCNEQWEVAPRSEIGLYLGDIQDHIVTMVANLVHVEKILSRGHSNYLAQISIKMNARQEETADTLGKLTVLGTIVLPMNIITGLWGMNVLVPGQGDEEHLAWFWCICGGLLLFGLLCYYTAKRVYGVV